MFFANEVKGSATLSSARLFNNSKMKTYVVRLRYEYERTAYGIMQLLRLHAFLAAGPVELINTQLKKKALPLNCVCVTVTTWTCIREMPGSNLGQIINCLCPSRQMPGYYLD
jgi:hypothetical protein